MQIDLQNFDDAEKNLHICLKLNSSFKPAIQRLANLKLKIGSWKDEVPDEIIKKIEKIFYQEMVELKYL